MNDKEFKPQKDLGRLFATKTKTHEKSPDYWGELAIDINDKTRVQMIDGLYVIKIDGWKVKSKNSGQTYLSLKINRYVPEGQTFEGSSSKQDDDDSDIPF